MTRNRLRRRLAAAVLGLALLAPPAALAQRPRAAGHAHEERGVLAALWDFVSALFTSGDTDNRGQMDPDGLTVTPDPGGDNRGQIDPNG